MRMQIQIQINAPPPPPPSLRAGGVTLLLDNCSLKGFGTGKFFWPIAGGLWMVAVNSWCSLDKALYRSLRLLTASQNCAPKKLQH